MQVMMIKVGAISASALKNKLICLSHKRQKVRLQCSVTTQHIAAQFEWS